MSSPGYSIELSGWVLGRRCPAVAIEVVYEGMNLWRVPLTVKRPDVMAAFDGAENAEVCGFSTAISALKLDLEFELTVRVILQDKVRVAIAKIRGKRSPLHSEFHPRLHPLMVTTLGRTGSTWLMRLLTFHPQIVAFRPFQYEPRVATYWIDVLRMLSEPASYVQQIVPTSDLSDRWWLGGNTASRIKDPGAHEWMAADNIEQLAAVCQSRVEAFYEEVARLGGYQSPRYFAEKYLPNRLTPSLMWELYPQAREVFLVRDFRDMLASIIAFNKKRGFQGFGRERARTDAEYVLQLRTSVMSLLKSWSGRADRAHLLRYEDLINHPISSLRGLLRYLDLDSGEATIESMLDAASDELPEMQKHRTSSDARKSMGRWREDLDGDLITNCQEAFGVALDRFGYDGSASGADPDAEAGRAEPIRVGEPGATQSGLGTNTGGLP
jgi:hypothetical protein